MNKDAFFSDGTASYVHPAEPEPYQKVTFWFRTAKDDDVKVYLKTQLGKFRMTKIGTKGDFDYYKREWQMGAEVMEYGFVIISDTEKLYYDRCGVTDIIRNEYSFRIAPGFSTPDWAKGAVMYQIFVDRFCNGDRSNDVQEREYIYIGQPVRKAEWDELPKNMDVRRFHGGDLQGVLNKLNYLQDLGVEVIYFNPLFVSPSNHKYDIQDYDYIDPHFGKIVKDDYTPLSEWEQQNSGARMYQQRVTDKENLEASNQLFIRLVEEMHRRGMKVILDGVFNHCGSFNKWMDRERIYEGKEGYEDGAFISADSPYRHFFYFLHDRWPYNEDYDGWWGNNTLPKLNYQDSIKLEEYILKIGKKWVSPPYNVDGWRLDVAADLGMNSEYNHLFWKKFRQAVKSANPNALILAEHYGDPSSWLQGDQWDSVMNYDAFMEPLTWFLTGMEKHSDSYNPNMMNNAEIFMSSMNHFMARMMTPSLQVAMNELSNHDHSRFLTRTNHRVGRLMALGHAAASQDVDKAVMREAVVVQMTWVGAPTVYYGDEAGVCGFTDPDCRRVYPWGNEDMDMIAFHREMIRIHRKHRELKTGSLMMLYAKRSVMAYGRFDNGAQTIVIVNNGDKLTEVKVPVWRAEVPMNCRMCREIYTYKEGFTTTHDEYIVENGELVVNMGPTSALVVRMKTEKNFYEI